MPSFLFRLIFLDLSQIIIAKKLPKIHFFENCYLFRVEHLQKYSLHQFNPKNQNHLGISSLDNFKFSLKIYDKSLFVTALPF